MDAKGRLFFPAEFRRQLSEADQRFALKRDAYQDCLVVYPYAAWEAEVAELRAKLNRWVLEEAMVLRQFMADVEVFALDAAGRFIVPKRFQSLCGAARKVAFLGLGDRIEIWDAARAAAPFMEASAFTASLQELMTR